MQSAIIMCVRLRELNQNKPRKHAVCKMSPKFAVEILLLFSTQWRRQQQQTNQEGSRTHS